MALKDELKNHQSRVEEYNNNLRKILTSKRLGDLIGEKGKELMGYSLFDFINMFKILRLNELGKITKDEKDELLNELEIYNKKMLEAKELPKRIKNTETRKFACDEAIGEMTIAKRELASYGIDPNSNNTIEIEDLVMLDFDTRYDGKTATQVSTRIFSPDVLKELSKKFVEEVFGITESNKGNLELYNLVKLAHLKSENYIGTNDRIIVEEAYTMLYGKTDNEEEKEAIRKELSAAPYYLEFTTLPFDFVSFIDYITFGEKKSKEEVTYESELSGSTR